MVSLVLWNCARQSASTSMKKIPYDSLWNDIIQIQCHNMIHWYGLVPSGELLIQYDRATALKWKILTVDGTINCFDWLIPGWLINIELKSQKLINFLAPNCEFRQTIQVPYLYPQQSGDFISTLTIYIIHWNAPMHACCTYTQGRTWCGKCIYLNVRYGELLIPLFYMRVNTDLCRYPNAVISDSKRGCRFVINALTKSTLGISGFFRQ